MGSLLFDIDLGKVPNNYSTSLSLDYSLELSQFNQQFSYHSAIPLTKLYTLIPAHPA